MDIINYSLFSYMLGPRLYVEGSLEDLGEWILEDGTWDDQGVWIDTALWVDAQRYFLTFDPVLNSYAELDTAFQPSGDFEFEAQFSAASSVEQGVFSFYTSDSTERLLLLVLSTGVLKIATDGYTASEGATNVADGKLHLARVTVTRSTGVINVYLNGSLEYTTTHSNTAKIATSYTVEVGSRKDSDAATRGAFLDGYQANVKIIDATTPTNSRIFPLAVGAGTTENSTINTGSITINNIPEANRELFTFDSAAQQWLGSIELVTNGTFDTDTDWTKGSNWAIANGVATSSGATDTGRDLWQYSILEAGRNYRVSVDIVDYTQGDLRFWTGTETYTITTGLGSYVFNQVYTATSLNINSDNTAPYFQGSIDNVSVKRLLELS